MQIGIAFLVVAVALDLGFRGLTAAQPDWLPRRLAGLGFAEDIHLRCLSAARQYSRGKVGEDEHLCVILGLSSSSEGIQVSTLTESDGVACRYLALGRGGRNIVDVWEYAQPVFTYGLRADLVVMAISPFHMTDMRFDREDPLGSIPNIDKPGLLQRQRHPSLVDKLWIHSRRGDLNDAIDRPLMNAHCALLYNFDQDFKACRVNPWAEMPNLNYPEHSTETFIKWTVQRYGLRGYYNREVYEQSHYQRAALVRVVQQFRERQAKVVIVLMPEHPLLRQRIPQAGVDAITDTLQQAFGDDQPPVIDRRAAIDPDGFMDISHMNSRGRDLFSYMLAEIVHEQMPDHPPLMSGEGHGGRP
jgi:hypothetical protein